MWLGIVSLLDNGWGGRTMSIAARQRWLVEMVA